MPGPSEARGGWLLAGAAGLCLAVPWVSPLALGPSVNTVPWLLSAVFAAAAWLLAGAPAPARGAVVAAGGGVLLACWLSGGTLERAALAGACGLMLIGAAIGRHRPEGSRLPVVIASAWLAAALLTACIALAQYFGLGEALQPWVHPAAAGEALGNLRQRNQVATLAAIGLAVLLWWPGEAPRALGWRLAAAAWLGAASAATASRTGLLQLLLLAVLAGLWRGRDRRSQGWIWLAAAVAYGAASAALPTLLGMVTGRGTGDVLARLGAEYGCSGRTVLWSNVLQLIAQHPLGGWGWGELDYAHFYHLYPGPRFCDILDNAHNLPLHLAVEAGLPLALLICGVVLWRVWRAEPWAEAAPSRRLAWAGLALILLHSMVEYPLWYGPFQLAAGLCIGLLSAAPPAAGRRSLDAARALACCCWFAALAYAGWDYWRVSQIYLPPESRRPVWRDDPLVHARQSWLFAGQARFAELTLTTLDRSNAEWMLVEAEAALHFSPEPRVIERAIESATMLGQYDEAVLHLARYRVAFPADYAAWRKAQQTQPLLQLQQGVAR